MNVGLIRREPANANDHSVKPRMFTVFFFEREGEGDDAVTIPLGRFPAIAHSPLAAMVNARARMPWTSRSRITHASAHRHYDGANFHWAKE